MRVKDPNKLLSKVSSRFGAPMGRERIIENVAAKVRLFKVRLHGDYDAGGAYWGASGIPVYAAIGNNFQYFLRSMSRKAAKKELLGKFPDLKFYK